MPTSTKKALVLSGGSVKGAFQAGAVKAILDKGYRPDYLYGISVGSLNSTFMAHEAAKQFAEKGLVDWKKVGTELWGFWENEITGPEKLIKKRCSLLLFLKLNWGLVFKNFDAMLDTKPLHDLVKRMIDPEMLKKCPVPLRVGTVNVSSAEIVYADPSMDNFLSYVLASTSIPIMMPAEMIGNVAYVDGGVRDVAPYSKAINDGADELVGVVCQAQNLDKTDFNHKDLLKLVSRIMDIEVNETVNNDIKQINKINEFLKADTDTLTGPLAKYKQIENMLVRPEKDIPVDIENFTQTDILNMLNSGYEAALHQIGDKTW
jgi:NTE family protein